jgi:hypothetical protein
MPLPNYRRFRSTSLPAVELMHRLRGKPSTSFAIYRAPAILFGGMSDGIGDCAAESWQPHQRVRPLENDGVGIAAFGASSNPKRQAGTQDDTLLHHMADRLVRFEAEPW